MHPPNSEPLQHTPVQVNDAKLPLSPPTPTPQHNRRTLIFIQLSGLMICPSDDTCSCRPSSVWMKKCAPHSASTSDTCGEE